MRRSLQILITVMSNAIAFDCVWIVFRFFTPDIA